MNAIENVVEKSGKYGVSMKNIHKLTGLSTNTIKWCIYNSKNITDCNPNLHGSYKQKIRVYIYQPTNDLTYIDRIKMLKTRSKKPVKTVETV
jgi:hypothetical protein